MFIYRINDFEELFYLMVNLAGYVISMRSRNINDTVYLQVEPNSAQRGDFRLAEMYMQMNHHQIGGVCPVCKELGEAHCGHLTFGKAI